MALDDLVQVLQHSSFLSAVLAGFAITLFIGLLTAAPERRVATYAAGSALVAGALLCVAAFSGISGVIGAILEPASAAGPAYQSTIMGAFRWNEISFLSGMGAFIVSLGLSGWIRSTRFGIFSSSVAAITILATAYFLFSVVGAY